MENISNVIDRYERKTYTGKTTKGNQIDSREKQKPKLKSTIQSDKVTISQSSKELLSLKEAVESTLNVDKIEDREKRVALLREKIQSDHYKINFDKIAEKMLDSVYSSS